MIIAKYIGVIDGLETYEVYADGVLIGTNQSITDEETE